MVNIVEQHDRDMIPVLIEKTVGGLKREETGAVTNTNGTGNGTVVAVEPVSAGVVVNATSTGSPAVSPAVNPPAVS